MSGCRAATATVKLVDINDVKVKESTIMPYQLHLDLKI